MTPPSTTDCEALTKQQEEERAEQLSRLKPKLKQRLSTRTQPEFKCTPPRYDEVFFSGLAQLDALAGEGIAPGEYRADISKQIWNEPGSTRNNNHSSANKKSFEIIL